MSRTRNAALPALPALPALAALAALALACGEPNETAGGGTPADSTATSISMNPGQDCTQCHGFTLAGTVYATSSPATAAGAPGAQVQVTDAASQAFTLVSDLQGSFYTSRAFTPPVRVTITLGASTASMAQTIGLTDAANGRIGCAHCHGSTQAVIHVP